MHFTGMTTVTSEVKELSMLKLLLLFVKANKIIPRVINFFFCKIRSTISILICQYFLGQNWQCSQQHVRSPVPERRS